MSTLGWSRPNCQTAPRAPRFCPRGSGAALAGRCFTAFWRLFPEAARIWSRRACRYTARQWRRCIASSGGPNNIWSRRKALGFLLLSITRQFRWENACSLRSTGLHGLRKSTLLFVRRFAPFAYRLRSSFNSMVRPDDFRWRCLNSSTSQYTLNSGMP